MVEINFMPWRKRQKEYEVFAVKKLLLFSITILLLVLFILHEWLSIQEDKLSKEVAIFTRKVEAIKVHSLININKKISIPSGFLLNQFAAKQSYIKQLLFMVTKMQSEQVCFTEIKRNKNKLIFEGEAPSAVELTSYLLQWPETQLFSEITIQQIEQDANEAIRFRFQAIERVT